MIKFTEKDIRDKERLDRMVKKEADSIFRSEVARRGRDYDSIEHSVRQGKIAELYLIENMGYDEADRRWHDLVDADNEYTEVKAYTRVKTKDVPFVQKDLIRLRTEGWNVSKWYILFCVEGENYELIEKIQVR